MNIASPIFVLKYTWLNFAMFKCVIKVYITEILSLKKDIFILPKFAQVRICKGLARPSVKGFTRLQLGHQLVLSHLRFGVLFPSYVAVGKMYFLAVVELTALCFFKL